MNYVCIGRIVNTRGLKGELKVQSYSDFDRERYKKGSTVYILDHAEYLPAVSIGCRIVKGFTYVSFEGMQDINLVEKYKECEIYIPAESRKALKNGEYYRDEITGMTAADEAGNTIGTITAVEETNRKQNHVRIQKTDGSEVLIPWVPAFVRKVDREKKVVTIHVIEGLL